PLPLQASAQRTASSLPSPPVIRSTIAAAVALGSAPASPAGSVIGQARKQSPQRVQASAIAVPRARNVSRNSPASPDPLICTPRLLPHALAPMILAQIMHHACCAIAFGGYAPIGRPAFNIDR